MGRSNRPHALCRGRCGWRAAYPCTLCQLDTPPTSRLLFAQVLHGVLCREINPTFANSPVTLALRTARPAGAASWTRRG